jgi:hypothetical protein
MFFEKIDFFQKRKYEDLNENVLYSKILVLCKFGGF